MACAVLFLYVALPLVSLVQGKGTKPLFDSPCSSSSKRTRIDVFIETGSQLFSDTDDRVRLLLRDSEGVLCIANDLNNYGDDHKRGSTDQFVLCCPADFARANGPLSILLIGHRANQRGHSNSWLVEHVRVMKGTVALLEYRFHTWTNPSKIHFLGVSLNTKSPSPDEVPSYSLIRF